MGSITSFAKFIGNIYVPSEYARWVIHQVLCLISRTRDRTKERLVYFVSKEKGFVFLINPLVASQSMCAALPVYARRENFDLIIRMHEVKLGPDEDISECFKFCFVRNPWERVVSCFHKKIVNANTTSKLLLISRHPKIRLGMRFEDFVEFLCSPDGRDEISDAHWMSQSRLLSAPDGSPLWDMASKLEEFPHSLHEAVYAAGIQNFEIPKIGASEQMKVPSTYRDYHSYFNSETWGKIARRYANDVEIFGYESMVIWSGTVKNT